MKISLAIAICLLVSFFAVRPIFTDAQSADVTVSVSANVSAPSGGGGGGGGGGSSGSGSITSVTFSGRAYPLSRVVVLKDGQLAASSIAGPGANFEISLSDLSEGNYTFSVYGEDSEGRRSTLFTFPVFVTSGVNTSVTDIFITPTIDVDRSQVKKGDNIQIFGQTAPDSNVVISVNSPVEYFVNTEADSAGAYLLTFDSSPLDMGGHHTKSKAAIDNEISEYGKIVAFRVGTENIFGESGTFLMGDLNDDGSVNLVDFSIAAFWYKRVLSGEIITIEAERLNADGNMNLVDFSIIAYHWTG